MGRMSTHRRSRAEWRAIVQRQARSGLSVTRFAARERLSAQSLFWWRWRLRSDGEIPVAAPADGTASTDKLELIPVDLARVAPSPVAASTGFELRLGADITLRIPCGFDARELRRLLETLQQSC